MPRPAKTTGKIHRNYVSRFLFEGIFLRRHEHQKPVISSHCTCNRLRRLLWVSIIGRVDS